MGHGPVRADAARDQKRVNATGFTVTAVDFEFDSARGARKHFERAGDLENLCIIEADHRHAMRSPLGFRKSVFAVHGVRSWEKGGWQGGHARIKVCHERLWGFALLHRMRGDVACDALRSVQGFWGEHVSENRVAARGPHACGVLRRR